MCGIFGSNNIEEFRELCAKNTERGNFVRSITQLFPQGLQSGTLVKTTHVTDFNKPIIESPFCIYYLGHVQSPTSEVREFNEKTSHPFTLNEKYLAHNGVLENDRELIKEHKLDNCSNVDSSVILPLIETLEGTFACWYYDATNGSLRIFRSGSTLHHYRGNFTSTAIPDYKYIDEGRILEYNFTNNNFNEIDKFELNSTPFFL